MGPITHLRTCVEADGGFVTWLIEDLASRNAINQEINAAMGLAGDTRHIDVIANALEALSRLAAPEDRELLARGAEYVLARQEVDGSWVGSWYPGVHYATAAVARLLGRAASPSAAAMRAAQFLAGAVCTETTPQQAAWITLGLHSIGAGAPAALAIVARGQLPDGSWPGEGLYFTVDRAIYASSLVTTAICLRALITGLESLPEHSTRSG